jgi:cell division septation protein DedD
MPYLPKRASSAPLGSQSLTCPARLGLRESSFVSASAGAARRKANGTSDQAPKPVKARRAPLPVHPDALAIGKGPVMQLGAYKSPQYVNAAWSQLTQKYPALRSYLPLRARFDSPKGTFYRLSVQGFANQREALARCELLKSRGGNCFVRGFAGDAPVQVASR